MVKINLVETYLEPCQRSMVELFRENINWLKGVDYFQKNVTCLTRFWIRICFAFSYFAFLFIYLFIYSFIYSFIHSFIFFCWQKFIWSCKSWKNDGKLIKKIDLFQAFVNLRISHIRQLYWIGMKMCNTTKIEIFRMNSYHFF